MTSNIPTSTTCRPDERRPLFAGLLLAVRDVLTRQRRLDDKVARLQTRPLKDPEQ